VKSPALRTASALAVLTLIAASCSTSKAPPDNTPSSTQAATSAAAPAPPPATGPAVATPVVAEVVAAPIPVPGSDGKVHLAYELKLTNVLDQDVTLTSVEVRGGDKSLLNLSGDRLSYWTRIIGTPTPTTKLGPAQTALVWLDVVLDKDVTVPTELVHGVGIAVPKPMPRLFPGTMTETVAPISVQTRKPVLISPPLSGPGWVDGNGCCDMGAHRMALNPIDGQLWAAERFAIDYVQLSADGKVPQGDPTKLESYPYFGADIHAVADGPVVAAVDGMPEEIPGKSPTGLALDEYAGNHVVQDLGNGNYALYAHIKTGGVKVKPGDRLTTGQVIGLVGNTGNTDAPHLHFHVMSTPDPLRSDGLPFVFNSFKLDSRVANADALGPLLDGTPAPLQPGVTAREETNVIPMDLDVMTYETK
jgi:peptidase M23-like protein